MNQTGLHLLPTTSAEEIWDTLAKLEIAASVDEEARVFLRLFAPWVKSVKKSILQ